MKKKTYYEARFCFSGLSMPISAPFDNQEDAKQEALNHHQKDSEPCYVLKITKEVVYSIE